MADLRAMPGAEAVASTDQEPLGDDMAPALIRLQGENERQSRSGEVITVSPEYFSVVGVSLTRRRAFTDEEVRNQMFWFAPGHPECNDGAQPVAGRRRHRPHAAVGQT